ncbi:hypothetical protein MLD38_035496 [Melastoma candidum]|uniref:Uncharacterized protein n=1 Tax=Melastoma candidum TaxID=119954 RepID=A0ACB9LHQ0_9MYRT|nr:hypothetical protein MLD38_035496 [Melastoma candidum]
MSVSATFLLPTPPLTPLTSLFPHRHLHLHRPDPLRPLTAYNSLNAKPSAPRTPRILPPYLQSLQPYLVALRQPVFLGYLFGSISVLSLSRIIPLAVSLTATLSSLDLVQMQGDGSVLIALVLSRVVSNYLEQAFLWNAVLNAVCEITVWVYGRGLERDLCFFEGRDRVEVEFVDVALRIAAEAEDVADTIYAALNTVVPTAMQVAALSTQMVAISPCLLVISTAVSIQMNFYEYHSMKSTFVKKQIESVNRVYSGLMAFVKKVLPSVLFVKANNAELSLVPQVLRFAYAGVLFVLSAGSLLILKGSFDGSLFFSFVTSLVLLVEPN